MGTDETVAGADPPAGAQPGLSPADTEAARAAVAGTRHMAAAEPAVSLLGRLFRLAPRLVELLDFGAREYGIGFARGRVLWALRESGPMLMRALSQALGISPRTVTGLVDALEADGWVTRSPHPTDRRATVISLTPAADQALARLDEGWQGLARSMLADVPEAELDQCRAIIGRIEARLDSAVAEALAQFRGGTRPGAGS